MLRDFSISVKCSRRVGVVILGIGGVLGYGVGESLFAAKRKGREDKEPGGHTMQGGVAGDGGVGLHLGAGHGVEDGEHAGRHERGQALRQGQQVVRRLRLLGRAPLEGSSPPLIPANLLVILCKLDKCFKFNVGIGLCTDGS